MEKGPDRQGQAGPAVMTENNIYEQEVLMKKVNIGILLLLIISLIAAVPANAGKNHHGEGKDKGSFRLGGPGERMHHQHFVSPEFIMRHQDELGLTDDQKAYMKAQIQEAEAQFAGLQWDLQGAVDTMNTMMEQDSIDEKAVLAELDKVLDVENKIKRTRLTLMIRLKNKLTAEQLTTLKAIQGKQKRERKRHGRVEKNLTPLEMPEPAVPLS